ncbi:2-dehydro-3-deoxygluconokinase [Microbacterium sp. AK009]|uniref:PfkB family carbohydrate kinase n=1 Tax=Microbacterium sp. AK009 TaxID=2723068 RepID=UPI0015CB6472|nr:PfkB family carbohydrate kinase [Microbacterium sp. AK009]NYF16551.1 2-dehydro-3-deoxygluconokinase [Microbacterium sp. AK009]
MTRLLLTVGEALAVFLAETAPLASANRFERIVSGAEVNVAVGFVRAGHRSKLVTRVGSDALGDAVARQLTAWRVDLHASRDPDRPTGVLIRTTGGATRGEAMHLRHGAAAETLQPTDVDAVWSDEVDVVFVSGVTAVRSASAAAAVRRTVELARSTGALVVVDPNLRPALAPAEAFARELAPLRGQIDIAIGDATELALLAGTSEQRAVATLLEQGARLVVEKGGADGAIAYDGRQRLTEPAHRAGSDVVDSVGAGDAFAAALIAAVLEDAPLRHVLNRAAAAAARVVTIRGDLPAETPS